MLPLFAGPAELHEHLFSIAVVIKHGLDLILSMSFHLVSDVLQYTYKLWQLFFPTELWYIIFKKVSLLYSHSLWHLYVGKIWQESRKIRYNITLTFFFLQRKVLDQQLKEGQVFTEYQQIFKKRPDAIFYTAKLPENSPRNRFPDVLPYEVSCLWKMKYAAFKQSCPLYDEIFLDLRIFTIQQPMEYCSRDNYVYLG